VARFRSEGLDELIEAMDKMGLTTGELAESMLFAGAEQIKKAWKKAAEIHRLKLTGQMIDSIGYPRKPKHIGDVLSIDIYPQGKSKFTETKGKRYDRKKRIRNAEVAFINHYGTSKRPGTHFVDTADDISGPAVDAACTKLYDEWLKKNGMD